MQILKYSFIASLSLFSMFFGSGNLVFPVLIGKMHYDSFLFAVLGLSLSSIICPLLAVFAMFLYHGDYKRFFMNIKPKPIGIFIMFCCAMLLGPFGIIPRTIMVSFAAFDDFFVNCPTVLYNFGFCAMGFLCAFKRNLLIDILGKFLTPILICLITVFLFYGFMYEDLNVTASSGERDKNALIFSIESGGQTLDMVLAFFYSLPIFLYLKENIKQKLLYRSFVYTIFLTFIWMFIATVGFASVGAMFAKYLYNIPPQKLVIKIASIMMGPIGNLTVIWIVVLACFTTAVASLDVFSRFVKSYTGFCYNRSLIITTTLSFITSFISFENLFRALSSVLIILYPAFAIMILMVFINKNGDQKYVNILFWLLVLIFGSIAFL